MIMGHPSVQESHTLRTLLDYFSKASRTTVNPEKSQIFIFNTPLITQHNIACILGFNTSSLPSKYLGAPLTNAAIKHSSWREMLDIIETKMSNWTHLSLNISRRLVLIKYVLQSLPIYLFSVLAAPKWVLKSIHNLQ